MTKSTPIEVLRQAITDLEHEGYAYIIADARVALSRVEALVKALNRAQTMPLLMKSWDHSSRIAAYDEIQAALAKFQVQS